MKAWMSFAIIIGLLAASATPTAAKNLDITNVSLIDKNSNSNTFIIEFDISWENSWLDSGAPGLRANWDAAWLFAKFSTFDGNAWSAWKHCTLLNTGSFAPDGSRFTFADNEGDRIYRGTFMSRSSEGSGSNNWVNARMIWDYGADGVDDEATIRFKLFGIDMVYIPEGSFFIGDTDGDNDGNFKWQDGTPGAVQITTNLSNAVNTLDNTYDDIQLEGVGIRIDGDSGLDTDADGTIDNASFPTGYGGFYLMKYELTQGQYRDFLNMLTRNQQNKRVTTQEPGRYTMSNTDKVHNRNGIRNPAIIPNGVITFGCDLDGITTDNTTAGDGIFDEKNDGKWIAANFISWMDLAAFADWAALRPMTELEYEKASRGGQRAVDDEHAWGNAIIEAAPSGLINSGETGELPNQGNLNYTKARPDGPFRVGAFADNAISRTKTGASYYKVMELSGNVWEHTVTVGNATGRSFKGTHGDGALSDDGYGTNSDWPGYSDGKITGVEGSGFRGGSWPDLPKYTRVANRASAANGRINRDHNYGGRLARTSP